MQARVAGAVLQVLGVVVPVRIQTHHKEQMLWLTQVEAVVVVLIMMVMVVMVVQTFGCLEEIITIGQILLI